MDKQRLEAAAQQLATAELVCRGMGLIAQNAQKELAQFKPKSAFEGKEVKQKRQQLEADFLAAQHNFDHSAAEVKELTAQANSLRARLPELAAKRYWWDVTFRPEEATEPDAYCFDDGTYLETEPLTTGVEGGNSVLCHKAQKLNYTLLSSKLTNPHLIPLFVDKKKLKLHVNDAMELREIYNVISSWGTYGVISYMNTSEDPSVAIWRNYQAAAEARRAEYDDYLKEHEENWDERERWRHQSFYTNEERWFAGQMSNEDYFRESLWREYPTWDKQDKMRDDISLMRLKAEEAMRQAREARVKSHKGAEYEINTLRLIPVGEVIYCGDELIAILLRSTPQAVVEYDGTPDMDMVELSGPYYNRRELFSKKPALIPLVRHIAAAYGDLLPEYRVLKPCPQRCPDHLWRVWAEIRWAVQFMGKTKPEGK